MAMSKVSMANKVITKVQAESTKYNSDDVAALRPFLEALCDGIIEEITQNMDIATDVTVPGVQAGPDTVIGTGEDTSIS